MAMNRVYAVEYTSYTNHHAANGELWNGTSVNVNFVSAKDAEAGGVSQFSRTKGYELCYCDSLKDVVEQVHKWDYPVEDVNFDPAIPEGDIEMAKEYAGVQSNRQSKKEPEIRPMEDDEEFVTTEVGRNYKQGYIAKKGSAPVGKSSKSVQSKKTKDSSNDLVIKNISYNCLTEMDSKFGGKYYSVGIAVPKRVSESGWARIGVSESNIEKNKKSFNLRLDANAEKNVCVRKNGENVNKKMRMSSLAAYREEAVKDWSKSIAKANSKGASVKSADMQSSGMGLGL